MLEKMWKPCLDFIEHGKEKHCVNMNLDKINLQKKFGGRGRRFYFPLVLFIYCYAHSIFCLILK